MPDGMHMAVWIGVNVEYYAYGKPALSLFPEVRDAGPDILNYTWRDYGNRTGLQRLLDLFDRLGLRGTAIVNSQICTREPGIIRALNLHGWSMVAHGLSNDRLHARMTRTEEDQEIRQATAEIAACRGSQPQGWLSPYRSPSAFTYDLLNRHGYRYSLDPADDDSVYVLFSDGEGELLSIPYSLETGDLTTCFLRGISGQGFADQLRDQFHQLYSERNGPPRIMGLSLHTFIIGQSFRIKYLEEVLTELLTYPNVWWTTSDELAGAVTNASTQRAAWRNA
jgi:peptidoglycan/xylan/chitin deacetylase (PgdA/CDA1 family)